MSVRAETANISFPAESCGISFEAFEDGQEQEAREYEEKEDLGEKTKAAPRAVETSQNAKKKGGGRQKKSSKEIPSKKGQRTVRAQSPAKIPKRSPGRLSQMAKVGVMKRPPGWVPAPKSGKAQFMRDGQVKGSVAERKEAIRRVREGHVKTQIRLQKAKMRKEVTHKALSHYLQQGMNALTSLLQGLDKMHLK